MGLEFVVCPVCRQRLGVFDYMTVGCEVVCANCETTLHVKSRRPLRVERVPDATTYNADSRPESYS